MASLFISSERYFFPLPETRLEIMKSGEKNNDDRIKTLEAALEEALMERQEILEAAAKEIDHHKSIAVEMEQKMMDDFEWKLREIEAEYRKKITDTEASKHIPVNLFP